MTYDDSNDIISIASEQLNASLTIVQCAIISLESSMKIQNAVAIESFTCTNDINKKKVIVNEFLSSIKDAWDRLKNFVIKIKNTVMNFIHKIILYTKDLFARVNARLAKLFHMNTAAKKWGEACEKVTITITPLMLQLGTDPSKLSEILAYKLFAISTNDTLSASKYYNKLKADFKDFSDKIKKDRDTKINKTVASVFGHDSSGTLRYITNDYKKVIASISKDEKQIVDSCNLELSELSKENNRELHTIKVKALNSASLNASYEARMKVRYAIDILNAAVSSIKQIAKYKPAQ